MSTLASVTSVAALVVGMIQPTASATGPIEHVITYGQSVAAGGAALPVLSTVQSQDSLMFVGGVRPYYFTSDRDSLYASLVPLVESAEGAAGETPTAGTLQMINDLRSSEDGVSYSASPEQYLGSDPAYGGLTLAELNYGSVPFYVVTENMMYGARRARELGVPYRIGAVTWAQGESDYKKGTARAAYVAGMKTMKAWIDIYARGYSGDPTPVPIIQHQVSSHLAMGSAYPGIALAQTDLSTTSAGFYVATPSYMMDFVDGLHLTSRSSKWLGAYYGLVYKRVVVDRQAWTPLSPTRVTASGSSVRAKFHVPEPPLVLDTTQVTDPGSYGFSLVTAAGVDIRIASVKLESADTIVITTRRAIPAGAKLRYAFKGGTFSGRKTGPRGNLRDSQGDTVVFEPTGINKRMDNWCVIFEATVTDPQV